MGMTGPSPLGFLGSGLRVCMDLEALQCLLRMCVPLWRSGWSYVTIVKTVGTWGIGGIGVATIVSHSPSDSCRGVLWSLIHRSELSGRWRSAV